MFLFKEQGKRSKYCPRHYGNIDRINSITWWKKKWWGQFCDWKIISDIDRVSWSSRQWRVTRQGSGHVRNTSDNCPNKQSKCLLFNYDSAFLCNNIDIPNHSCVSWLIWQMNLILRYIFYFFKSKSFHVFQVFHWILLKICLCHLAKI